MFEFDRRLYIVDFEILLDGANLYNYDCVWEYLKKIQKMTSNIT